MDDMNVRMQCLQLANQIVMYNNPDPAGKSAEAIVTAAERLYNWVKGVTA